MFLVGITIVLILIGLGFFVYGAFALSKYAFRLGTGPGLLTLLFPPYTIYFAFFKLEEQGKSKPTASWLFGLVLSVLMILVFWGDLTALARGDMERFERSPANAAAGEWADESGSDDNDQADMADQADDQADMAGQADEANSDDSADADAGDTDAKSDSDDTDAGSTDEAGADEAGADDKSESEKPN